MGMLVLFVTGGCPVSRVVDELTVAGGGEVSVAGGSVDVAVPVPGPVRPLDVIVEVVGGSKTLEKTELISPKMDVSGLPGVLVLDELVTMPVGAMMISDELDVTTGFSEVEDGVGSSEVAVEASSEELLVGVGRTELLVSVVSSADELVSLLVWASSVDEDSAAEVLVLVLVGGSVEAAVLSSVDVSGVEEAEDEGVSAEDSDVDEEVSDDETVDELSDELSEVLAEVLSDELSLVELLSDEFPEVSVEVDESVVVVAGVWAGGVTTIVLVKTMVVTPELPVPSGSAPDCRLVVSVELGSRLSSDVSVELVTWRLTWRGK